MTRLTEGYNFEDRTLIDRDGEKIGKVEEVYTDRDGGQPEWALVHSGLFGMKKTFVPLRDAQASGEDVRVGILKEQIKDAPHVDPDGELSDSEEQQLFEHYGASYAPAGSAGAAPGTGAQRDTTGHDVSGPTTDDAMTRSEEELTVGTARRERGRARLRKYVVTEQVTKTVPVQREEVRVEREPITDANVGDAMDGPDISEEEHEVVLHEEEAVVEKRAVPKERVRMETDTVTDQQEVSEEVRKERIETDDVDRTRR